MAASLKQLSDEECIALLRLAGRRWLEQSGIEAFASYQVVQNQVGKRELTLPAWLDESGGKPSKELARTSRAALQALLDGEDEKLKAWLASEIVKLDKGQAQIFDPGTLAVLGLTLIGCILAARVKKIGSTVFYKGIDPELAKVLKAASGTLSKAGRGKGGS